MTDNCEHRALPPKVKGKLHGHLTVIVDEIVWCGKNLENVIVLTKWWGDDKPVIFRPCNVAKLIDTYNRDIKVMFDIRTNTTLFENYLINCKQLEFCVIKEDSEELIGRAFVFDPHHIIEEVHFQKYCPILNPLGVKIADLHVVLNLWLKQQRQPAEKEGKNSHLVQSSISSDEQIRPLHKRRGCKACAKHMKMTGNMSPRKKLKSDIAEEKPPHDSVDISEKCNIVPPNTVRSDHSEALLSDVYERAEKLRKAMVMSILEDCNISNIEQEFSELDRQSKMLIKDEILRNFVSQNISNIPSAVTDEVRVMDYLLGKEMTKEDEMQALKTLHTISPLPSVLNLGDLEKPDTQANSLLDEYCLSSGREHHHDTEKSSVQQKTYIPTSNTTESEHVEALQQKENEPRIPEWWKKVNSVRISVELLRLTATGVRKMYNMLQKNTKHSRNLTCDLLAPTSVTYFIEAHFTENIQNSHSRAWKYKPSDRFCSRKEVENIVYFGQSCIRYLNTPFSMRSMNSWLMSSQWLVFWRHLNQRVPSSLGSIIMENLPSEPYLENTFTFPVATENTVNGYVRLKIELGKGKHCFGYSLMAEENQSVRPSKSNKTHSGTKVSSSHEDSVQHRIDEDAKENFEPKLSSVDKACQSELETETLSRQRYNRKTDGNLNFSYDNLMSKDLMMCPNCKAYQNVKITKPPKAKYPSVYFPLEKFYLCSVCDTWFNKTHKQDEVLPKQTVSDECVQYRVHEFLIGIESIEDVPFSKESHEDMLCYVDYKFFQTDVPGYVKMSANDFTSKIENCSMQTYFSTVHRHCLCLPDNVPLTTTLGSFYPGISFRLWMRRFTPSPRDHMVGVALLPLDKICSFDWKFDSKNKSDPVVEILELPLTLVKSLSTSNLISAGQNVCGKLRVSMSYRKYYNEITSHEQVYAEKGEVLVNAGRTDDFERELGGTEKREYNQMKDHSNISKQYEENCNNRVYSSTDKTVKLRDDELGDLSVLNGITQGTVKQSEYSENELRYLRRRFWTGDYERKHYDTGPKPYLGVSGHDHVIEMSKYVKSDSKTSGKRVELKDDNSGFRKNSQDLSHVSDYRFHDEVHGLDRSDSKDLKCRFRVNFQDSDYDVKNYRLKHRSYDSLTDGLYKLYSDSYPLHTSLKEKIDSTHSYRSKHLSYEDIRGGSYVGDIRHRPSKRFYDFNNDRLTRRSYESLRDTENSDLRYRTHGGLRNIDFSESQLDSASHKSHDQLDTSDLRNELGNNFDSNVIGCRYKYSSEPVDTDKRYVTNSVSKSLPVEAAKDQIHSTNESLYDIKGSSVGLLKTSDSCVITNSNAVNSVSNVTVNTEHVPLTTNESESTVNKNDSQYYDDDKSDYHKITSDVQNTDSAEIVEIFIGNKESFNADKSDVRTVESHLVYTDGKRVDNLSEVEHADSESKQSIDKSVELFESESQAIDENIKFQQSDDSCPDADSSHVPAAVGLKEGLHNSIKCFKAYVEIEQAMHLPMKRKRVNSVETLTRPSTYVTFRVAGDDRDVLYSTGIIQENCNPVWNKSWEVELPTELLQVDKRLVFCVCEEDMGRDFVLGHAAADLTLFMYGLPFLRSWININDFRATCIGQIKINIMPLEDISQYQQNCFVTKNGVSGVYNVNKSSSFYRRDHIRSFLSGTASESKAFFQHLRRNDNGEAEGDKSKMTLGEKLAELDNLIHRFEKKLYFSDEGVSSPNRRRLSRDNIGQITEMGDNYTGINVDAQVIDSDEVNQCRRNNAKPETNVNSNSVDEIIAGSHSDENKNTRENENVDENIIRTSHSNCDHCLCHCCLNIGDRSEGDDIRLQYLLNPLVFHHLLTNISQMARTEVLTTDAGYQTEFSELVNNEELISRQLASGMSAPEEEISKNNTDASIIELEQFFRQDNFNKEDYNPVSEFVENPFLLSSDNDNLLLQSDAAQQHRENPEGRGDKKKPEKVASRLQRQSTFVIEKQFDYGDNTGTNS